MSVAGDWIKMSTGLQTHPKVVRIASALRADRFRVIGGLHAVWCLFDAHSIDGSLPGYTTDALDDLIGWSGFSAALVRIGWLEKSSPDGLRLPRFATHNGASAKRRAQEADRKRVSRSASACGPQAGEEKSASDADKKRTREEKRRDIPPTPKGRVHRFPPGFDEFWSAYPKKVGKDEAAKAFAKRKPDAALLDTMLKAISAQKASEQWRKDGGQFIPNPATWLNQGRWQDEVDQAPKADDLWAGAR